MTPGPEQAQPIAHGARWVWCPRQGLMENAWVICQDGVIKVVSVKPPAGAELVRHGDGLLMPGLVNAHTHLELSFMAGQVPPKGDFVDWVTRLVNQRPGHDHKRAQLVAHSAAVACCQGGTVLVGDITNTGRAVQAWLQAGVSAVSFGEAIGPSRGEPQTESLTWRDGLLQAHAIAAHAPYSIPAQRIKELKFRSAKLPFCIHLAESRAEMEFFKGRGDEGTRLRTFLSERGLERSELGLTADRPLQHLINLGVVDKGTLLVHGIQLDEREVEQIALSGAKLCICPRSNLGLTGSLAPVSKLLAAGVKVCLGTDSLASAPDLSLWTEMRTLQRFRPELPAETILRMATLHGAIALGLEKHFGSLSPGCRASLVYAPQNESSAQQVLDAALSDGGFRPV